ncbi:E3 ubiquitin-protein ligase RNF19A [Lingula anatina]|uniref:RBR-type E3 ubiquitin transferase n=2 Tax=Lingula anatina TaxID=7574 RepID=A0A1S3HW86_LINAN|nr:E3 ubiquitin-protein ligase RNF19A [Lingula anatina]|eukprot:XP_013390307.1 E3 ubiquitin-protein ligase RNF19A [Lingula anatina]
MFKMGKKGESDSHSVTSKSSKNSEKRKSRRFSLRHIFYPNVNGGKSRSRGSLDIEARSEVSLTTTSDSSKDNSVALQGATGGEVIEPFTLGETHECPLCLGEQPRENFPGISTCHHRSCRDCLRQYLRIEITESRVNIACPECSERYHPNDIRAILNDDSLMCKYEQFMLRRVLVMDSDARWCPAPDCSYAVIATGCASCPKLKCERPGCYTSFCYHCKQFWHPNQTCDAARAQRSPHLIRSSSVSYSHDSASHNDIKPCPRCSAFIIKMDDGSCNHMTCAVCGAEFCWLCMKEISDLHYLSPSGCTFWGKKPWSRKKKILWQLGTLVGAPVGIGLVAGIAVPAMIIGIPVWIGRKLHAKYQHAPKHKRNLIMTGGVSASIILSPILAGLAVGIGVPILLAYVYGVVPISLCRSGGCGVSTTGDGGVRFEFDDDQEVTVGVSGPYAGDSQSVDTGHPSLANPSIGPSIGEASVGMTNSLSASGSHIDRAGVIRDEQECDRDSSSNRALAGSVLLDGSLSGSAVAGPSGFSNRLEVHVDVSSNHSYQKRASLSSESANFSLSDKSNIYSDDVSTKALAGSITTIRDRDGNPTIVPPMDETSDHQRNHSNNQTTGRSANSHGSPLSGRSVKFSSSQSSPTSGRSVKFVDEEGRYLGRGRKIRRPNSGDRYHDCTEKLSIGSLDVENETGPRDTIFEITTDHSSFFKKMSSARSSGTSYESVDSHVSTRGTNICLTEVESDRPASHSPQQKNIPSPPEGALCNIVEENHSQRSPEKSGRLGSHRRRSCELALEQGRLSPDSFF